MKVTRVLVAGSLLALAACQKTGTPDAATAAKSPAAAPPVMTVNGTPISPEFFDFYVKNAAGKSAAELTPDERNRALDSLARIYVLTQQADKDGVTKDAEVTHQLELSRLSVLQNAAARQFLKDKTPTEQEVRAEYEAQVAQTAAQEYRARHILVQSEQLAQRVLKQLSEGRDFGALARNVSIDPGSKQNGGDLGWFSPNAMVPQFRDAVMRLKKGETTKAAVQTQYGYHIIRVEDVRDSQPPAFDAAKEQVGQLVQRKKLQARLDELLKAAKIEPALAGTAAAAAPATAPATEAPMQP